MRTFLSFLFLMLFFTGFLQAQCVGTLRVTDVIAEDGRLYVDIYYDGVPNSTIIGPFNLDISISGGASQTNLDIESQVVPQLSGGNSSPSSGSLSGINTFTASGNVHLARVYFNADVTDSPKISLRTLLYSYNGGIVCSIPGLVLEKSITVPTGTFNGQLLLDDIGIESVNIRAEMFNSVGLDDPTYSGTTNSNGNYGFSAFPYSDYTIKVVPFSGNDGCGVTTQDIIEISKHITGTEPFTNVREYLSADVNGSESITTVDLFEIQQVILDPLETFPVWIRILPQLEYNQLSLSDPFDYEEEVTKTNINTGNTTVFFQAIKTGDVNNNCFVGNLKSESILNEQIFRFGEPITNTINNELKIPIYLSGFLNGLLLDLSFNVDPNYFEVTSLSSNVLTHFSAKDYALNREEKGDVDIIWFIVNKTGLSISEKIPVFYLHVKPKSDWHSKEFMKMNISNDRNRLYTAKNTNSFSSIQKQPVFQNPDIGLNNTKKQNLLESISFQFSPNPFKEKIILTLTQAGNYDEDQAVLRLYNSLGQLLEIRNFSIGIGHNQFELSLTDNFTEGTIFYNLQIGSKSVSGHLIKR